MNKKGLLLQNVIDILKSKDLILSTYVKPEDETTVIKNIHSNSSHTEVNSLFICKGIHFSKDFLNDAIKKGSFVYMSETKYEDLVADVSYILVSDIRRAMAYVADAFTESAWKKLNLIGITGTKGKSTTAYFMKYILDDYLKLENKNPSAILSGIDNYDGVIKQESHLTTPESLELHKHFENAVSSNIEYLTMEVTSQALKYHRVQDIVFDVGCFINIGIDHISDLEHSGFEDYFASKLLFFKQCKVVCVNQDMEHLEEVMEAAKQCERVITFGLSDHCDIYAYDIVTTSRNITFRVKSDSFDKKVKISIPGYFNIYNALAAISMCYALNIPFDSISRGLKKAKVSGRMEVFVEPKKNLHIIVDYAHNKMSFEALFDSTMRDFPNSEISIVFGCPGKKAYGRRKELGEIAGKYADKAYITEEDAGEEPVLQICEEIAKNVADQGDTCECAIIEDREEAIRTALREAKENGVILITAKGRETRQKRGLEYVTVRSDVRIVKDIIAGK